VTARYDIAVYVQSPLPQREGDVTARYDIAVYVQSPLPLGEGQGVGSKASLRPTASGSL